MVLEELVGGAPASRDELLEFLSLITPIEAGRESESARERESERARERARESVNRSRLLSCLRCKLAGRRLLCACGTFELSFELSECRS